MNQINVLVACEESQSECMAFRELGFNAYSCDIQPCRRNAHPEWHIHHDVTPYLDGVAKFCTQDGKYHHLSRWHLIIAHPPCTYLCKVGSIWLYKEPLERVNIDGMEEWLNEERVQLMMQARRFFYQCLNAKADYVAVENPLPMRRAGLPPPSCFVDPSWYGVGYTKKTLYWLKNLPPLMAECINPDTKVFVHSSRGKYRSRTFPALAQAIARQWGEYVRNDVNNNNKK